MKINYVSFENDSCDWIASVPGCRVVVTCVWHHNGRHYCFNVKSRVLIHNLVEEFLFVDFVSLCFQPVFCWNPSFVIFWVGLVTVVICLNQEPSFSAQLIRCVDSIDISFNDDSLICFGSRNDVINWP